ncbi:hypothetical protein EON65_26950 [archaeon]|nr:MAG: hypothetical protein EON65_26950 [archaeon]
MFVLLLLVVASHQVYSTLRMKTDIWPMRYVYMRCIEISGRIALPLVVLIHFQNTVNYFLPYTYNGLLGLVVAIAFVMLSRELFGLMSVFEKAFGDVIAKVNDPLTTIKQISVVETLCINMIMFKRFSLSMDHIFRTIETGKHLVYTTKKESSMWLRNVSLFNELLGKPSADSGDGSPRQRRTISAGGVVDMQHDVEMTSVFTKSLTANPMFDQENGMSSGELKPEVSIVDRNTQQDSDDET